MFEISALPREHLEMNEKIHSGQFMISEYDEESDNEDARDEALKIQGYKFDSTSLNTDFQFVKKGQSEHKLEIDESLNTMFRYLSIAMSGKITNPKWNSFKGVKFQPKDKIRLNNIIWREYHMQFVKKLKPVVVQFASPLPDILQINGNVVLEGKYWKRRINIIVHQYKKWREYSKNRVPCRYYDNKQSALFDSILVQRSIFQKLYSNNPPSNLNDIFMDLDDLNLPIDDISGVQHNCQIIQPQLTSLQPRMESSIDFLNDYFCAPQKTIKSQKPFSSETALHVPPQEINDTQNRDFFQSPTASYSDAKMDNLPTSMLPLSLDYVTATSKVIHKRKSKLQSQYQHKAYHSKGNNGSSSLCKTPNLLSILLQPISAGSTQIPQYQTSTVANPMYTGPNKSSFVTVSSNYTGSLGQDEMANQSSMSVDKYSPSYNTDLSVHKPQTISYDDHQPLSSKYSQKFPDNSLYNQSTRIKHSLTATNIVQQYLDELGSLLVSPRDQNKISKAALLHKASENIKRLRSEKQRLQSEIIMLQSEIDSLQNRFSAFCSQLPATGVCVSGDKSSEGIRWFEDFVTKHSLTNWKFYIFSMMFESLFTGYNNSVSTVSMETLAHNVASWLEKECSLMKLRLIVINGMRNLSRRTSIVHSPRRLEDEVKGLIEGSQQCGHTVMKWPTTYQVDDSRSVVVRQVSHSKNTRYKTTNNNGNNNINNSWSHLLSNEVNTSKCSERQDV